LAQFLAFAVELEGLPPVHQRALELSAANGLPAVYDAHYLALAELLGITLWTADENLVQALHQALPFVHWIGEYPSP
jgi:predicted nucleic acid-binding protein